MARNLPRWGILLWLLCLVLGPGGAARAAEIPWESSYEEAVKKAKATGRPILIDFYADWCGPCKQLDKDVYPDPGIIKASEKFIPLKINTDTSPDSPTLGPRFKVGSLPTILFISPQGQVLRRFSGYVPAARFAVTMAEALEVSRDLPQLRARYAAKPDDLDAAARLTAMYAKMDDDTAAKSALARVVKLDKDGTKKRRSPALRAIAEMYVARRDVKNAVAHFRAGALYAQGPEDAGFCRLSAAYGSLMMNDIRGGVKDLIIALHDPRVPNKDKKFARELLDKIPTPLW